VSAVRVHVTARLGSLRINAFFFCPLARSSPHLVHRIVSTLAVTLVSTRSESYPVQSSRSAHRPPSLTAENQRITHIGLADVKSLKVAALRSTHRTTTMPRSGLGRRIWEEFGLYIGPSALSVCVFPPLYALSIPRLAPFVLAFLFDHRRTVPHPRRRRARHRAPHNYSVNSHKFIASFHRV
jgi:hypothetical protein